MSKICKWTRSNELFKGVRKWIEHEILCLCFALLELVMQTQRCGQKQVGVGRYASSSSQITFKAVKNSKIEWESFFNPKISHCNSKI